MCGQKYGPTFANRRQKKKNNNGRKRSQNLTTLVDWEVSTLSTLSIRRTKITKKLSKTQGESWKCPWAQPCFVRRGQRIRPACGKLQRGLKHPTRFQIQDTLVWWNLMNPQDSEWNHLYHNFTKITLQAKESTQWVITIWCTNLFLCRRLQRSRMRQQQWRSNGTSSEKSAWQLNKVKSKKGGHPRGRKKTKEKSTLLHWWTDAISRIRS